jgi:hypothetical protein
LLHIDWQQPWFAPWADDGKEVLQAWLEQGDLPQALNESWQANKPQSAASLANLANLASHDASHQQGLRFEHSAAKRHGISWPTTRCPQARHTKLLFTLTNKSPHATTHMIFSMACVGCGSPKPNAA